MCGQGAYAPGRPQGDRQVQRGLACLCGHADRYRSKCSYRTIADEVLSYQFSVVSCQFSVASSRSLPVIPLQRPVCRAGTGLAEGWPEDGTNRNAGGSHPRHRQTMTLHASRATLHISSILTPIIMATAHTPDTVAADLTAGARRAIVEAHEPRDGRITGARRCRPIES